MDSSEFLRRSSEVATFIVKYLDSLPERSVIPDVEPGFLRPLLPEEAPERPEKFEDMLSDVESKILPGLTHWQHPNFHAYFPAGNSFPSLLGGLIGDGVGCIGFSWASSPAIEELEMVMLDWLAKMIGLPPFFLFPSPANPNSNGGGCLQSSASESILDVLLAARTEGVRRLQEKFPGEPEVAHLGKLIAYCSKEAHSSVEKAAMIAFVRLRILHPPQDLNMTGAVIEKAMQEDIANGLVPFFISTTLGTTGCASFDHLSQIGPIARKYDVWFHVDAAYAGNMFVCPEKRGLMNGIEHADSVDMNLNKWLLVNFDASCLWVKDRELLTNALTVDPLYLRHSEQSAVTDYRHWGIPLSRRFRALKIWFTIRSYGVSGLQEYIRLHCRLAKRFEEKVLCDERFERIGEVHTGLVCFRLKAGDKLTETLLARLTAEGKVHMVPTLANGQYVIRFCVCAEKAKEEDIDFAWSEVARLTTILFQEIEQTLDMDQTRFNRMTTDAQSYVNTHVVPFVTTHAPCSPQDAPSWVSWPLEDMRKVHEEENKKKVQLQPVVTSYPPFPISNDCPPPPKPEDCPPVPICPPEEAEPKPVEKKREEAEAPAPPKASSSEREREREKKRDRENDESRQRSAEKKSRSKKA